MTLMHLVSGVHRAVLWCACLWGVELWLSSIRCTAATEADEDAAGPLHAESWSRA